MTPDDEPTLLECVGSDILDEVDFFMREYGADVSLYDHAQAQRDKHFSSLLPKTSQDNPDWTEEQVVAAGMRHLLSGEELLWCGISRRIANDDPAELARSASLYARLELWWGTRDECNNYLNFSHDMLRALSAGDTYVIQKFAAIVPNLAQEGAWDSRVLHNGVIAAINRDDAQLAMAIEESSRWSKPKKYLSCFYTALTGLLNRDATLVAEGISSFLKASRKLHQDEKILKAISLEAHGIYELCRWYSPELIVAFDHTQGLPWDRQLCEWVASSTDEQPFHDVTSLSPTLQRWLVELPIYDRLRHDWE
ncbi:MAG: hypothetical protein NXI04_03360 [Planctomycetaceae bacterium]|nr:hypothetical protein [Planctomycetaceae bacterium]